jgi:hypothetical protein
VRHRSQSGADSEVTDAVIDESKASKTGHLHPLHAIVYVDALFVKLRQKGRSEDRAVNCGPWKERNRVTADPKPHLPRGDRRAGRDGADEFRRRKLGKRNISRLRSRGGRTARA